MSFTWNELVCHGLLKEIGEREVVCHIMDFVKPLRRDFLEEEAREYHSKQYLDHIVIHPWCNIFSSSPTLFKVHYYELGEEYKDAWMGRPDHVKTGRRKSDFIRFYSIHVSFRVTAALWPSDIAAGRAGRLDVVKRGRERRARKEGKAVRLERLNLFSEMSPLNTSSEAMDRDRRWSRTPWWPLEE
jgi:hypothetical protein